MRIGETLGSGAVGRVVRIECDDGRVLAGKILHASHRGDTAAAARFAQEARVAAALRHRNVVEIFGVERIDGEDVLLMQLVDGPTLAQHLARNSPLPEDEILALARGIASGLAHAHGAGIVHRDLKPANVLVDRDATPLVADFGMARASSIAGAGSDALTVLGTPDYMAPESIDPLAVDARADLYALGCILYEMATGRPPFGGATPFAVLRAHREDEAAPLPDHFGIGLRELVAALLAKSPARRPQAAATVVDAIDRIAAGQTVALAVRDDQQRARCSLCGRPVLPEVGACLSCGRALLRADSGSYTVIVVGPGDVGDKLDSELRERLRQWLLGEPALGLRPSKRLERRIPRLPFTLATKLSQPLATAIVDALARMGLQAIAWDGHPLRVPQMRSKVGKLSGRIALVALGSSAGLMSSMSGLAIAALATVGTVIGTTFVTSGAVTEPSGDGGGLAPALREPIDRLVKALPAITSERHRDGVRAVVERALVLSRSAIDARTQAELAHAVDVATVAAARLDRLDRALAGGGLGGETTADRDALQERDRWAARLARL
ncbi:MAG TPA: protein kinase, partial [Nannocystaceae bacterium]|nr:protein kinase [Nannocystaceae bacterium]